MTKERKSTLQDEDKFMLRLPDGMRDQFTSIAKNADRSLNSELVHRLQASLLVPEDVVKACADLAPVDALDFAIKLLKRAGLTVSMSDNSKP